MTILEMRKADATPVAAPMMAREGAAGPRGVRPEKPYPEFPLYAYPAGMWAKSIWGKKVYFGPWGDPDGALDRTSSSGISFMPASAPRRWRAPRRWIPWSISS